MAMTIDELITELQEAKTVGCTHLARVRDEDENTTIGGNIESVAISETNDGAPG